LLDTRFRGYDRSEFGAVGISPARFNLYTLGTRFSMARVMAHELFRDTTDNDYGEQVDEPFLVCGLNGKDIDERHEFSVFGNCRHSAS